MFLFRLTFPNQLDKVLEADTHQKLVMNFNLKETNTGEKVTAHQVFIRMTSLDTNQEIFFVGEADSENHYTFVLVRFHGYYCNLVFSILISCYHPIFPCILVYLILRKFGAAFKKLILTLI